MKLVRNEIPKIIRDNGEPCEIDKHYRKADPEEMRELLEAKLHEEVGEYIGDGRDPKELADILEVILHLALLDDVSPDELYNMRRVKTAQRGGFDDRWVLFERENMSPLEVATQLKNLSTDTYWCFFSAGVGGRAHAFLEFVGLMSKYADICGRAARDGIDFTMANEHNDKALPVEAHDIEYLAEKFACIFKPVFRANPEYAKLFAKRALDLET